MRCEICGEGDVHTTCWIYEGIVNSMEVFLLEATPIVDDITVYGKLCNTCGIEYTGTDESEVNRMLYVMIRRKHGLPDSIFQRKWKET